MIPRYSSIISRNLRISSPPGIKPGIPGQRTIPLATMLYRRGLLSCPTGRTGGAVLPHSASQPSPGFKPPPTECKTRRIPFIYMDDIGLQHSGGWGWICEKPSAFRKQVRRSRHYIQHTAGGA